MSPLLFPFQSSTETRNRKYVFSGLVLSDRQSRMMIDYLAGPRKFKRFGALYQDDEYGKSFLTAFEADLGRHGLKLTATEPVKPRADSDSASTAASTARSAAKIARSPAPSLVTSFAAAT